MLLCLYFLFELQREFLLLAILILRRIDLTPCLPVDHLPCPLPRLMAPWQLQYLPDLLPMAWCRLHRCLLCILRLPKLDNFHPLCKWAVHLLGRASHHLPMASHYLPRLCHPHHSIFSNLGYLRDLLPT